MMGKSHDEHMIEVFRADPTFAASLVNSILKDGDDQGELNLILQHIAAAGLNVSPVSVTPKPTPCKRTKTNKAKSTPGKRAVTKKTTRHPATRSRKQRTAAAIA